MKGPGFLAGTLLGGLVGAGIALLCSPKSGEERRRELAAWHEANRINDTPRSLPGEIVDFCGDALAAGLERVERALESARQATSEAREQLSAEWERQKRGS